ncbi:hypothetical protein M3M33_15255, partial [Loigolactobacillus coryniformis]|uniref:hypothetical protein n=1 Tax=Loigolactobacillus coryniformis TaxID=1610 RepID=UPI00201B0511
MRKHGIDPEGIDPTAAATAPGTGTPAEKPAPATTATPPDTVAMTSPEGDIYYIPKANVEKARAKG